MDELHWPEGFNVNMDDLPWLASSADVGFNRIQKIRACGSPAVVHTMFFLKL